MTSKMTIEKFEALSKEEKKVLVAKDVLAQIKAGKYIANKGEYVKIYNTPIELSKDIKKNFNKIEKCYVCGIGACLMSITRFANKLTFEDVGIRFNDYCCNEDVGISQNKIKSLLTSVFTEEEIATIESLFEGGNTAYAEHNLGLNRRTREAIKYNYEYTLGDLQPKERLIYIMKNIIANKGKLEINYVI